MLARITKNAVTELPTGSYTTLTGTKELWYRLCQNFAIARYAIASAANMRQADSYTVIVFDHHTSQPRQFSIRKKTTSTLLIILVCLIGIQGVFVSQFLEQRHKLHELDQLRADLDASQREASAANSAIEQLRFQLADMKALTTKVREMLGLQQDFDGAVSGQGGEELSPTVPENRKLSDAKENAGLDGVRSDMQQEIQWLRSDTKVGHQDLQTLVATIESQRAKWYATPAIWPVNMKKGWVTSEFGRRLSPFTGRRTMHHGIDIRAPVGTPVFAPAVGIIAKRSEHSSGFGKVITIDHGKVAGGKRISTKYGHLHTMTVKVGQTVERGEMIGTVGNTGLSTGPHLHYEVIVNKIPVNPRQYIIE